MKMTSRYMALLTGTVLLFTARAGWAQVGDLKGTVAQLPGLSEPPDKGPFLEVVKALRTVYPDGKISFELYPFKRSMQNVLDGSADFHIPNFINPEVASSEFPYNWVPERMRAVTMILYSHKDRPLTKAMLDAAKAKGGKFPYVVEVTGGTEKHFGYPSVVSSNDVDQSLKKLQAGRIDGILWGDEADGVLKKLKLGNIHREKFAEFDDIIVVPKTPRGEQVKQVLNEAMKKLRASGKLKEIFGEHPYQSWQPSDMGW